MTPEFSRLFKLDSLGQPKDVVIDADPAECAALATRFGLQAVDALSATAQITPSAAGIEAKGQMTATVTQTCVATADPVPAHIVQDFAIRFVAPEAGDLSEEMELSVEDCDVMDHDGQAIDLGEAVAQTLGLALDPYPRSPAAEDHLRAAGVLREEDAGPFAALAALKDKLTKG